MRTFDVIQGSEEWLQLRAGVPTASNFDKLITSKGEASKQAQKYLYELAVEKISGQHMETYKSAAMQRGNDLEDEARQAYQIITGNEVVISGFCMMDDIDVGCSVDGMVGNDGLVEIKVPLPATHVEYLLDGQLPTTYFQQVQGQLLVTGRKWCDFMSYYPGVKPLIVRVYPDKEFQIRLKSALVAFCRRLDELINKIKQ